MLERRYLVNELRLLNDESRTITGTAIVFNSLSELLYEPKIGQFREIIKPTAITQEFLDSQDVVMLYNHDKNSGVLARSKYGKGSLRMNVDNMGVHFEFDAKDTALSNEVYTSIRNGDLDACSFSFQPGKDIVNRSSDRTLLRTIESFDSINDLSIVVNPAYSDTTADIRSLKEFLENENRDLEKEKELQEYYKKWDRKINTIVFK